MNKGLAAGLGAVAVVGAAYVGASAWTGQQVKKHYEAQSAKLAAQLPFLKVVEQRHEAGLFTSTHTMTLRVGCVPQAQAGDGVKRGEPLQFTAVDHIQHGPLPGFRGVGAAAIDSELVLPASAQQALAKLFGERRPLTARTLVGFDGSYTSAIASPAASLNVAEGQSFGWGGLTLQLSGDASGQSLKYDMAFPSLEMKDAKQGVQMKFSGMSARGEAHGDGSSLLFMAGKSEGEIASMEMSARPPSAAASEPFRFALNQLKFKGETTMDKELVSTTTTLAGTGQVGATKLDKIEMTTSLKRLHAPSYLRFVNTLMDSSFSCDDAKAEPDPMAVLQAMQASLAQMLPYNPEYSLDKLAVEMGGKRGELSYGIAVAGVTEEDLKLPAPALLLTKSELKADVKLPVAWIEQLLAAMPAQAAAPQPELVDTMIEQFAAQGFVVRDGEFVSSSLRFKNGQAEVNGKPLQLGRPPQQ